MAKSVGSSSGRTTPRPPGDDSSVSTAISTKSKRGPVSSKLYDPRVRYGWWNVSDAEEEQENAATNKSNGEAVEEVAETKADDEELPIQLPPWEHAANNMMIQTPLEPKPQTLHEQNRPLSELHPATSLAQALPYISDRPPSFRHLQVDTQAVSFPGLGGEAEPLFCSVAIYHVETVAQNISERGMAPIPDLQRCGKVTETLSFDVVSDPSVEKRCRGSLCPYSSKNEKETPRGTRCGVFPLPSNLSVHNLYVIITVSKVISDGGCFEPYLRPKTNRNDKMDLQMLREKAAKASSNHGKFIMPFAFGVAPLLQVFGGDVPRMPSSRAVQIPLFRFNAGDGERQIIDHIMVMLYPRADHRMSGVGGPAPVTNGGTAMLVMRNFGYLGLHEVVNSKSSLARDRLVDFTGEVQFRRRENDENDELTSALKTGDSIQVVPGWRSGYVAEATQHGGRCVHLSESSGSKHGEKSCSALYAQELAPLPLLSAPIGRPSGAPPPPSKSRARGHSSGEDIEPYFYTSFCNEIVCNPRLLHNCPKGNIVVKVEMREIEWSSEYNAFFAHNPSFGPVVHNPRRGSFLIREAYTSCSARCTDPHFLDEFKLKLPLILERSDSRSVCLFFTVYRLSFSPRKKWSRRLRTGKKSGGKVDEISGEMVGESGEVSNATDDCHLIQLGCGFLPIEKEQSLLANGNHDLKIAFIARHPLPRFCKENNVCTDTLILSDMIEGRTDSTALDDNMTEDGESQGSGRHLIETASAASLSDIDALSESMDESKSRQSRRKSTILLQVRVSVQSSLHSQNSTLNEFLSQDPDVSTPLKAGGSEVETFLRLGKDEILRRLNTSFLRVSSERHQYETKRLLISTVDIAKSDMCSVGDLSAHLIRVTQQLWKVATLGTGNIDLEWANPAAILPLRVHAFATLLQILGSSTLHMSKRGATQVDGNNKWNFKSLGRVLALLFDEDEMFGKQGEEPLSEELLSKLCDPKRGDRSKSRKKRRHVRSNFEFLNNGAVGGGSDGSSALMGDEFKNPRPDESHQNEPVKVSELPAIDISLPSEEDDSSPLQTLERREKLRQNSDAPKVDSVIDFRSALEAGSRDSEYDDAIHEGQHSGNEVAASWIKAFGGSTGGLRRGGGFMTAPAPSLAPIREGEEFGEDEEQNEVEEEPKAELHGPLDQLSSEIVRPPKSTVKQFRVPKRSTKKEDSAEKKESGSLDITSTASLSSMGEEIKFERVPVTEHKRL